MKRLYYLTPTLESAESVSDDLHAHGVTDWHFHVLSQDEAGLIRRQLHSANFFHRLDITHSMERGFLAGSLLGVLVVLVLMTIFGTRDVSWVVWAAILVFCVMAGSWVGGMAGVNLENYKTRRFLPCLEQGGYLLMIDVPKVQVETLKSMMANSHPEAKLSGIDSTFSNPFKAADLKAPTV